MELGLAKITRIWFIILVTLGLQQSHAKLNFWFSPGYDCAYCQPEQIHIAFGEKPNDITVVWSTRDDSKSSIVKYGVGAMDTEATGTRWLFTDGGPASRQQWYHRVVLPDLKFNTTYLYHVGSVYGWSERLSFTTPPAGEEWIVRAAIYGDMGSENAHSLSYLQNDVERGYYDFIIHVGDFGYNLATDDGLVGDQFMRQIQPIATVVPYMTCPGNHETFYNFSNYKNIFSMPGDHDSLYYSWNVGPVHFIAVSTELYYNSSNPGDDSPVGKYGFERLKYQFNWLKADLQEATKPENRQKRPWIIMYGHRPMYCSSDDDECQWTDVPQRNGFTNSTPLPEPGYGLEPLLKEFGVDLIFFGHEHSYERMWPIYDFKVYNGSTEYPYVNPRAPVHIITGSAGCKEETYQIRKNRNLTAFSSSDYGYTKFEALNKTHIHIEQISVDKGGEVIDSFWLVKEQHEPFKCGDDL